LGVSSHAHWRQLHPIADAPRLKQEDTLDMAFAMMSNRQSNALRKHRKWTSVTAFPAWDDFARTFFSNAAL